MSTFPSPEPQAPSPLRLPPTERDFEIYDAIHIDGSSTRNQAKQHEISQTRVRQIIRRVVEWLGEVLPPQTKIAKEQETRLARQIAADRFQRQFEQINELWKATLESKFASIRIRLTTAQARLGAVGGLIDGLAADAIEGLPVPTWQTPADPVGQAALPASEIEPPSDPNPLFPPPGYKPKNRPGLIKEMPRVLWDPLYEHEITPEVVAARAAWGKPISPVWIKRLQEEGKNPRDDAPDSAAQSAIPAPPPPGDCSPSNDDSSAINPADATPIVPTPANPTTCEQHAESSTTTPDTEKPIAQPLLTTQSHSPVVEVRVSPEHQGAATLQPQPDTPQQPATPSPTHNAPT